MENPLNRGLQISSEPSFAAIGVASGLLVDGADVVDAAAVVDAVVVDNGGEEKPTVFSRFLSLRH